MSDIQLKHVRPEQYESWLRKAEDPEWDEERFGCSTRSKAERAAAALALELRDQIAARDEFERKGKELCCAYGNALITIHDLRAALERMAGPFTVEEWNGKYTNMPMRSRETVNVLLAERKEK